jgi:hypothetical protein
VRAQSPSALAFVRLVRGSSPVLAASTAVRQGLERVDDSLRGGGGVLRHDDVEPQKPGVPARFHSVSLMTSLVSAR